MNNEICKVEFPGSYPVVLTNPAPGKFDVLYGSDHQLNLSYHGASLVFGSCVLHAASCAGLVKGDE